MSSKLQHVGISVVASDLRTSKHGGPRRNDDFIGAWDADGRRKPTVDSDAFVDLVSMSPEVVSGVEGSVAVSALVLSEDVQISLRRVHTDIGVVLAAM